MAYDYPEFKKDVYKLTDINLDLYKERQMKRRIEALIDREGYKGFEDFFAAMKRDTELKNTFVTYLTINVSQFYRNPTQWEIFEKDIIPYITKKHGKDITVWSAACSTGDEPYTIAMILSKHLPFNSIRVIATDIDEEVMKFAKEGVYSKKSVSDLPKEFLDKHFTKLDDRTFKINEELKKCIHFKKHNLLKDEYPKNVDIIVCRNVVIYFTDEAKDDVYRKFHDSLKDEGILFIGSTEQIIKPKELGFEAVKTFFYKKI
ncbi:MAG: protein-glutamate O-methyltransferase CheR [Lachnospiraceae bacterium]|nr:protein-glutamate O-methyltransferase CheR [Lachnospiraceae bacterium]